ncbi:hypothetical protein HY972_00205 [Candidatus Kaiserbacteria bacterium]|nr:hypothetical protein [Candidatus Kaiserbacteria bacterium]
MNLFSGFFRKGKKRESVVLVDIGAASVAGAYARFTEGELPILLYTRRLPVEPREGEPQERAMLRALKILGDTLIREGAPALMRHTGSGRSDLILASIDAPWQKTTVRTERFEQKMPFLFTKSLASEIVKKTSVTVPRKILADETVIGTILNGYRTNSPYGKRAHRATLIILTSLIDESIADHIVSVLRSVYHTKRILPIAGSSLRYQAMHAAFPHERDALIIDATGPQTSLALIRRGLSVSVLEAANTHDTDSWTRNVIDELAELAKRYPLPRTIFLLAREPEITVLREKLDAANLGKIWLSDTPPHTVSVLASHIGGLVHQATTAPADLPLLLMALFYQHSAFGEKT